MDPWLQSLMTIAGSILASSGFWAYFQIRREKKSAATKMLMGLAYDKISHLGMSYIERGHVSKDEYEDFRKYLYEPYVGLGGNGVAERIMCEVSRLPLRTQSRYAEITKAARSNKEIEN